MFRVKSCGDTSFYRKEKGKAEDEAKTILQRNGCGFIEEKQSNGLWKIIARFEPWYGIVPTE